MKNQKAKIVTTQVPGSLSKKLREEEDQFLANGLQGFAILSGIVVDSAIGSLVKDVDGNSFLDIIAGIGVNGLGHSHPVLIAALHQQLNNVSVGSFTSMARIDLLQEIQRIKYHNLSRLQLYSSGASAVESALRLAKNKTGKHEFASFSGGFHGKTLGTLALMGSSFKQSYGPFPPGNHILPYADCFYCPFKLKHPDCGLMCIEVSRKHLKSNLSSGLAAIIIEPIQGTAGNVFPPNDFMTEVAKLAKEFDALLIVDEMITGFGRTGTYWALEHSGVIPDIITVGKQFGGGVPVSGILTTDDISNTKPWGNYSGSSSSYGGNPLSSRAAATVLKIIREERLVENCREVGEYFKKRLQELAENFSFLANVRGMGLLLGVDFVNDKKSLKLQGEDFCKRIFSILLKNGLLSMAYSPRFRIQTAMTIDRQTVDNIIELMEKSFKEFKEI